MWSRAVEVAPFRWAGKAVAVRPRSARRPGKAVAIATSAFRTTHVAISIEASITPQTGETVTVKFSPPGTSKTVTFKLAATRTGETISFEARTLGTTCKSFALKAPAFRTTPIPFAVEATALGAIGKAI